MSILYCAIVFVPCFWAIILASHPYGVFGTNVDYEVSNRKFVGSYADPTTGTTATITVNVLSWAVKIIASDCILEKVCGLCGTADGDSSNDIHVRIGDTNAFNILTTSNADRHEFGDSWCNEDISQAYGGTSCTTTDPDAVFEPSADCLTAASSCCADIWTSSCETACVVTSELDIGDWIVNCEFDACAYSDNTIQLDTCANGIASGYFNDPTSLCQDICEPPSEAPTPAPTDFDCSNQRYCRSSNDPHFYTWDSLRYDYHGVGYFDYFAPCNQDDYSLDTGIPFVVTVRQDQCSNRRATPTCVKETFITIVDGTTTTVITIDNLSGAGMIFFVFFYS